MWGRFGALLLAILVAACAASPSVIPTPDEQVQVRDETGWLLAKDFNPPNPGDFGTRDGPLLYNPDGSPRELVLVWFTGICLYDRSVRLTSVDGRLRIDLDVGTSVLQGPEDACPAMGMLYTLALSFDREVPAASVDLRVQHGASVGVT